jgi:NAD+ synthase
MSMPEIWLKVKIIFTVISTWYTILSLDVRKGKRSFLLQDLKLFHGRCQFTALLREIGRYGSKALEIGKRCPRVIKYLPAWRFLREAAFMKSIGNNLARFNPAGFIDSCRDALLAAMKNNKKKGIAFGASGGIDSVVTAALCMDSNRNGVGWPVIGLQMIDARVQGEDYHPDAYGRLGVELIKKHITDEAVEKEKQLHMPPRWLTVFLMKLVLRGLPVRSRRWFILEVKSGKAPQWGMAYLNLLTLLHRIRIAKLREFAAARQLLIIICSNRTEALLGYFVEQGVDDTRMGDLAPIAGLYKTQVIALAEHLGLPDDIIRQRPSPGFGGIYDEEILGPYELADQVLAGFELGYPDEEVADSISAHGLGVSPAEAKRYVRFLRALSRYAAQKSGTPLAKSGAD